MGILLNLTNNFMFTVTDAGHTYELPYVEVPTNSDTPSSVTLQFIHKEEQEGKLVTMINGTTTETVIDVLIDRMQFLDEKLASEYNKDVIQHLNAALLALQNRTADREQRAVEGTNQA